MWMLSTWVVTRLLLFDAELDLRTAKYAALAGIDLDGDHVADRKKLSRMGLYPKRRTGVEACVIFADVPQKRTLGDRGVWAGCRGAEPDVFRPDCDLDIVAGAGGEGHRQCDPACHSDRPRTGHPGRNKIDEAHEEIGRANV